MTLSFPFEKKFFFVLAEEPLILTGQLLHNFSLERLT